MAGVADAERIRSGEWWRAVTAMTLHADVMHVLGNVVASVIFVSAAGRWLGPGVAAMLILLAGTGANLLTALVEKENHLSVGASTATFAALGLVVGLQSVRRWRGGGRCAAPGSPPARAWRCWPCWWGGRRRTFSPTPSGWAWGAVWAGGGHLDSPRAPRRQGAGAVSWRAHALQLPLARRALGAVVAAWARALGRSRDQYLGAPLAALYRRPRTALTTSDTTSDRG